MKRIPLSNGYSIEVSERYEGKPLRDLSEGEIREIERMKQATRGTPLIVKEAMEVAKIKSIPKAAKIVGISIDSLKYHYRNERCLQKHGMTYWQWRKANGQA